jgi:predicted Zn-dependent protease
MLRLRIAPIAVTTLLALSVGAAARGADDDLADARKLLLTGRYAEAATKYESLAESHPLPAALGLASCLGEQGKYDEAVTLLTATAKQHAAAAEVPARLAELAFERGQYDEASRQVAAALKLDEKQLAARWILAELQRTSGKLEEADKAYSWFVDYYNATDSFERPEDLRYIGLAAGRFARWNRLPDQFAFLVNDLYPSALELDQNYWPAHLESGLLFLEKFNQAEATKALAEAAKINPNSADVQAALAELAIQNFEFDAADRAIRHALAINPRHLRAQLMKADRSLANFESDAAAQVLEGVRKQNAVSEPTLGRLAGCYGMLDGLDAGPDSRMQRLIAQAQQRNAHCGVFYSALADSLDKCRKFPHAAQYYQQATAAMPQLVGPRGQLGLMYMRLGEEDEARKVLDESFEIDPFNVRVSNSIKVLEVLDGYATLETEHFIIRYDGEKDAVLARHAARYLEEYYPELCKRLDFEPPEKSLFELFNRAKNTDGHGWFSARMVGLPQIHTIGACAGKMVALTSPTSMKQRFNWARVLKHEFVHVINLQQTNFNVPHWFTEALAVLLEDTARPPDWNEMLARRVPAGKVFNLDTINLGFIRPHSSEDWQMAYCQAEIYAQFMLAEFGEDALAKMLSAYADNLKTKDAIQRSFGVSQEDFDKRYSKHLADVVKSLAPGKAEEKEVTFAELQRKVADEPDDLELAARLAVAYVDRKMYPRAGPLAQRVLDKQPKHQLATYVKAKLLLSIGQTKDAEKMLAACLDRESPRLEVLKLLAGLKYQAKDYQAAEELYALASKQDPGDIAWTRSLAMVHLKSGDEAKLTKALAKLAEADGDDLLIRQKLASLALKADNPQEAGRWAREVIEIDVMDYAMHRVLADSLLAQEEPARAADHYDTVTMLRPQDISAWYALAQAHHAAGASEQAKEALEQLLKLDSDHAEGKALRDKLNR